MIIVKDWEPLTIITKGSILDVAAVLDPPLGSVYLFLVKCAIQIGHIKAIIAISFLSFCVLVLGICTEAFWIRAVFIHGLRW